MSINKVSGSLLPYYGPTAVAKNPPAAGSAPIANAAPKETVTRISSGGQSNSANGRNAQGIGLYQRISQYRDNRAPVSGLTKSWDDIVRENQFEQLPQVLDLTA